MRTNKPQGIFRSHFCSVCGSELTEKGNGFFYCPTCNELSQTDLSKVQQFLLDYPDATLQQIATQFSFDLEHVQQLFDSGELSPEALKKAALRCRRCHKRIPFGNYCTNCKQIIASELGKAFR